MHGEILGAIKNAECASESMRTLSESSAKMLEQFGRRQDALAPTNELLAQMFKRVRDMAGQVDEIDEKAAASRTRMEKMLELPDQIVREAKAQSAQLNDVCRSVRKVFGSLSRVSLEANERVEQFNKSRQESDDRSMKLQEELREAGETMREWVREAERVQSRLENSIERAPKLDRTHPSQSFARLLDLAVGRPGDVEEPVVEEPSPGTSGNMEPTVLTNVADGRVPKRTADEIAAMIREAENRSAATTF
jgi:chromosome segregation ATPase